MSVKILGVTGPTGAGKSLLCRELSRQGIPVIDADAVYHTLLVPPSPCLLSLRHAFGDEIFRADGTLDRDTLSTLVFSSEEKLRLLNATVLHFVLEKIREEVRLLSKEGSSIVAVDAPTLIESGFHRECHRVLALLSPATARKERIMARDGLSEEKARARIEAQPSDDFYREHSHFVLYNDGDWDQVLQSLLAILRQIREEASVSAD